MGFCVVDFDVGFDVGDFVGVIGFLVGVFDVVGLNVGEIV
jgi:hypothetical protein